MSATALVNEASSIVLLPGFGNHGAFAIVLLVHLVSCLWLAGCITFLSTYPTWSTRAFTGMDGTLGQAAGFGGGSRLGMLCRLGCDREIRFAGPLSLASLQPPGTLSCMPLWSLGIARRGCRMAGCNPGLIRSQLCELLAISFQEEACVLLFFGVCCKQRQSRPRRRCEIRVYVAHIARFPERSIQAQPSKHS